jgi:hypothetical protein
MGYETSRGPAHTWDKRTTGRSFTAAQLKSSEPTPRKRKKSS